MNSKRYQTLKAELEAQGFNVLYQGGKEGEQAICALQEEIIFTAENNPKT